MEIFIAIALVLVILILALGLINATNKEMPPQNITTHYYRDPDEGEEKPIIKLHGDGGPAFSQWEIPELEPLVEDADMVWDNVPVFVKGPEVSQYVGAAVVFIDQGRYNVLMEISETNTEIFKKMTAEGLHGVSITPLPPEEPVTQEEGQNNA